MKKPELEVIMTTYIMSLKYSELKETKKMNGENSLRFVIEDDPNATFVSKKDIVRIKGNSLINPGGDGYFIIEEIEWTMNDGVRTYSFVAESILSVLKLSFVEDITFNRYSDIKDIAGNINYYFKYSTFNTLDHISASRNPYTFYIQKVSPEERGRGRLELKKQYKETDLYSVLLDLLKESQGYIKRVRVLLDYHELPYNSQDKSIVLDLGSRISRDKRAKQIPSADVSEISQNTVSGYPLDALYRPGWYSDPLVKLYKADFYIPEAKRVTIEEIQSNKYKNDISQMGMSPYTFRLKLKNNLYNINVGDPLSFSNILTPYYNSVNLIVNGVEKDYMTNELSLEVGYYNPDSLL